MSHTYVVERLELSHAALVGNLGKARLADHALQVLPKLFRQERLTPRSLEPAEELLVAPPAPGTHEPGQGCLIQTCNGHVNDLEEVSEGRRGGILQLLVLQIEKEIH